MTRQLKVMVENRVIKPSNSPWSTPLFAVPKKVGKVRFVVDFKMLNDVNEKSY